MWDISKFKKHDLLQVAQEWENNKKACRPACLRKSISLIGFPTKHFEDSIRLIFDLLAVSVNGGYRVTDYRLTTIGDNLF